MADPASDKPDLTAPKPLPRELARVLLRTSLAYWFVAMGYIMLSDWFVESVIADPDLSARVQTYKGWGFVTLTALLLFVVLRGQLRRWVREVAERRRAEESLRTRIIQIQAVLAHQPIAFFACDLEGRFTLWEGRTWPEVNFPPPQVIGRKLEELAGGQPEARAMFERALQGERTDLEVRAQTRTFEVFHSVLHDSEGRRVGISGVVVDITERKRLEAQLLRAQRLESVGRLAGGVAHDLNNILSPVLIGASLLRQELRDPDSLGLLETIESSAKRGASIIRQLLMFSRGAAGEIVPVALQPLIADMRNLVRETFPKNISVRSDGPRDALTVMGNATQIHQVLMNLAVNARDAMPEGGTLTFSLASVDVDEALARENPGAKPGRFVVFRVQDTGTGIAPEHVENIFDPFFTTKEAGRGTGLGLSTVVGIVKSHGGFIQLETALGVGTTFSIFLPQASTQEAPLEKSAAPTLLRGQGESILVVDDEVSVRRVLRQALEGAGYRVIEAEDGEAGIARFNAHSTDIRLIITDLMMPTMDAVGLVRAVRTTHPELPIISVSGVDRPVKEVDLKALGVSAFLSKPFALDALLNLVRTHLVAGQQKGSGVASAPVN